MPHRDKRVDPVPNEFASDDEAAEFWDMHDTTDYPEAFQTVEVEDVHLRRRRYEVEIDEDVIGVLQEKARQCHVSVSRLASDSLRRQLIRVSASPSESSPS